ncbi:hypothetical protein ACIQV3_22755 [Streptomyces sp. NPDC099050]|uniref:hypothetical protein n=1 Tax=Streptomyces sp. NPDC099050 TaxID=3366100 RepID=UPI00382BA362
MDVRVVIDGVDYTDDCDEVRCATPRVLYDEDDGQHVKRFAGPQGFQLTLVGPSERLLALVDGGRTTHSVTIRAEGVAITHTTRFVAEWTCSNGLRKMFGCLAWDPQNDARWVEESQLAST